jgi:hypothetical protein
MKRHGNSRGERAKGVPGKSSCLSAAAKDVKKIRGVSEKMRVINDDKESEYCCEAWEEYWIENRGVGEKEQ